MPPASVRTLLTLLLQRNIHIYSNTEFYTCHLSSFLNFEDMCTALCPAGYQADIKVVF